MFDSASTSGVLIFAALYVQSLKKYSFPFSGRMGALFFYELFKTDLQHWFYQKDHLFKVLGTL
jgi:hypothetical protein